MSLPPNFVIDLAAVVMGIILLGRTLLPRRLDRFLERLHHWIVPPVRTKLTIDAPTIAEDSPPHGQQLGFTLDQQIGIVEGQLQVIGLTKQFAGLTIFVGHGSTNQNTPPMNRLDNSRYGSGTKVPSNVRGLVGVMDGPQSDLRIGLPFQMVWVHEPMRLTFVVEGQPTILSSIIQRHWGLQTLFDNLWFQFVVLDMHPRQFVRYLPTGTCSTVLVGQLAHTA